MGFSAGGIATLEATKVDGDEQLMDRKFKAAIGYYPVCSIGEGDATVPTLIMNGDRDDWSPANRLTVSYETFSGSRRADVPPLGSRK